ncbi:MAG: DUF4013 domain-containing protein [Opitutae bacterium]|nr:DUF4013 domain-containing protein [Opitutae bacterium]
MPTLEQVCKRLFSDSTWFVKCVAGALLLAVPVAHFFAFGYLYALVDRARRGESLELPEWEDWRRLFSNGVIAFVIFLALGVVPLIAGWLLTWPFRWLPIDLGVLVYLPLAPAIMAAAPLTAAGIYQYQKREQYRDALRAYVLVLMLASSKGRFLIPSFAFVGLIVTLSPLMTFTLFVGLAASLTFFAAFFRAVEESRKAAPRFP